jgi:hypothetical protein
VRAALAKRVQPGVTPVLIAERLEWVTPEAWRAERDRWKIAYEANVNPMLKGAGE